MKNFTGFLIACLAGLSLAGAEPIKVLTRDGIELSGDFLPPQGSAITIVLLHGLGSNKEEWRPFSEYLHSQGLGVLIYDARGHGESVGGRRGQTITYQTFKGQGPDSEWGKMVGDLEEVVKALAEKKNPGLGKIAVGGASIGANIALRYAATDPKVPFAILLSPGLNYQGLTTEDAILRMGSRPVLACASPSDRYADQSVQALRQIAVKMSVISEPPGAGHGVQMFRRSDPEKPSPLERKIFQWIQAQSKSGGPLRSRSSSKK